MMGQFVSYMLQVALVMTLLYLPYKWMLSTSTFYKLNRWLLLAIYVVSWTLPALVGLREAKVVNDTVEIGLPVVITVAENVAAEPDRGIDWVKVLVVIYSAGVALSAVFTGLGAVRMLMIIAGGARIKRNGYLEVINDNAPGPFSWGRYVVIRTSDTDNTYSMVVGHEKAHLSHLHWLDLIPAQLNVVLQWFSPAAWLMLRELKDVHEFQVDREMAGDDPVNYQMMLLKKTVGSSFPVFADSLNHSQIKKRITMMMLKKSRPSRNFAAMALPAFAALAVFTLYQPAVARITTRLAAVSLTVESVLPDKVSDSPADVQPALRVTPADITDTPVETVVAEAVASSTADGGNAENQDVAAEEEKNEPVYFVDGKLYTGNINDLSPSDIKSMWVVKNDPAYPSGKIMIVTKASKEADVSADVEKDDALYYIVPEKIAEYKGGMSALKETLSQNIKTPEELGDKPVRVIVQFTIGAEGQVSDAKVVRSGGEAFDTEALRVIGLTSGNWEPGEVNGKPVATKFTLPVTFKK